MKSICALTESHSNNLKESEILLGYEFADAVLLQQALIHSSFGFERLPSSENNETLEFLGDAVLDLAISDMLLRTYPGITEGELTKMRAGLVREATLEEMARTVRLGDFLMLGKGEDASQGREKPSILACAFEAILGAIYMDRGYENARHFVLRHFEVLLPPTKDGMVVENAKSLLQEKLQEHFNQAPSYHHDKEEGPAHAKNFTVSVRFGEEVLGMGSGSNKKLAEQRAAETALENIDSWWEKLCRE